MADVLSNDVQPISKCLVADAGTCCSVQESHAQALYLLQMPT